MHPQVYTGFEGGVCCLSCGTVRNSKFTTNANTSGQATTHRDDEYQYIPLKRYPREIRLVVLLPGRWSDAVCCRIITVELQSLPHYTAASYTWATEDGDATKLQTIVVYTGVDFQKQSTIRVTTNCFNTLRQLRLAKQTRNVWIDAISIDQSRIRERNHQVGMMDKIYRDAATVEICIHAQDQDYHGALGLLVPANLTILDLERLPKAEFQQHAHLLQLKSLFGLRYFSRVWVIQEVLSAEIAILHVNEDTVRFTEKGLVALNRMCMAQGFHVERLSHWPSIWGRNSSIVSLLNMSVNCSASDPRDKVFAIVSLLEPHVRARISIDYMASTHDVFAHAAIACITECGDLGILSFARIESGDRCSDIPSFTMANFVSFLQHTANKGISEQSATPDKRRLRPKREEIDKEAASRFLMPFNALAAFTMHDVQCQDTRIARDSTQSRRPQAPRKASSGRTMGSRICDPCTYHTTACGDVCRWMATPSPSNTLATQVEDSVPETQVLPRLEVCASYVDVVHDDPLNIAAEDFLEQMNGVQIAADLSTQRWLCNLRPESTPGLTTNHLALLRAAAKDMARIIQDSPANTLRVFGTKRGVGMTDSGFIVRDAVYRIVSAPDAFLLREVRRGIYRIVGNCHYWARTEAYFLCPREHRDFDGMIIIY
jgi:hypothetical protein